MKADISEDRASGRSRGFGTVLFETGEQAAAAIEVRCEGSRLRDAQNAAPQAFAMPVAAKLGCRGSAWARRWTWKLPLLPISLTTNLNPALRFRSRRSAATRLMAGLSVQRWMSTLESRRRRDQPQMDISGHAWARSCDIANCYSVTSPLAASTNPEMYMTNRSSRTVLAINTACSCSLCGCRRNIKQSSAKGMLCVPWRSDDANQQHRLLFSSTPPGYHSILIFTTLPHNWACS